jgi:hypothetical protein
MDSSGNYLALAKVWSSTRYGYITKIDPEGNILSTARIDASSISFEPYSMCLDSSDNIYIVGRANGSQPYVIKYNSSFSLQWAFELDGSRYTNTDFNDASRMCIDTDGTDVFVACNVSASGQRIYYFRMACSNGDLVAVREMYRSLPTDRIQYYTSDLILDNNYIYIGAFDQYYDEAFVLVLDKSTNNFKSNTYHVELDTNGNGSPVYMNKDNNNIIYAAVSHRPTSDPTHQLVAKLEGDAAVLQGDLHLYGSQNTNGALYARAIPTNNSNNDVILWGDFRHTSNFIKPTFMSVDNSLDGTINWMNYYDFTGTYDDGNENSRQVNMDESGHASNAAVISKSGTHIVALSTMRFDQDASNTDGMMMFIISQAIDGTHSAPQDASLTVTTNGMTRVSSNNPTATNQHTWEDDDQASTITKTDKSSSFSINTSYSMYSDSVTF